MKKSFALLMTIILMTFFSYLSISIIETSTISSNIDKLKYLHLQANIHMDYIKKYIKSHTQNEIDTFILNDMRFKTKIISQNENNQTIYHISIKTINDTEIRICSKLFK